MTTPNTQSVTLREALEKTLEAIKETAKWDGPTDWSYMISYIESALSQPPAPEQASGERGITKINPGFRWDANALHHVPQLLIEFTPVPANSPSDAKGWVERDALANLLAATPTAEPAGEAVDIAKAFHDEYERLAPSFGYETRADTKQFDPASPNGRLMIAVVGSVQAGMLQQLHIANTRIKALQGLAAKVEEQEEYILRLEASQRQLQSASPAAPEAAKPEPKLCKCGISSVVPHICAAYPMGNPAQMAAKPAQQAQEGEKK